MTVCAAVGLLSAEPMQMYGLGQLYLLTWPLEPCIDDAEPGVLQWSSAAVASIAAAAIPARQFHAA